MKLPLNPSSVPSSNRTDISPIPSSVYLSRTDISCIPSSVYLSRMDISCIPSSAYLKIEACQLRSLCLLLVLPHVSVWRQRREKKERGVVGIRKRGGGGGAAVAVVEALRKKKKGRVKFRKLTPPLEC